jgi:hypothetical protein
MTVHAPDSPTKLYYIFLIRCHDEAINPFFVCLWNAQLYMLAFAFATTSRDLNSTLLMA